MSDKKQVKKQKAGSNSDAEKDKKTSETVNLSAEELRRISGGYTQKPPPGPGTGGGAG
jgi:hypothetical protein